ncbi:MAG: hypothetical protein K8R23_03795 [Chthoniobacter sp.]|nr:hypothetical protein [Chthoniobacter sp.]
MKRTLPLLALLATPVLAAENVVPTAFAPDRYAPILEKSPFALATPQAPPPPPPSASFAANWFLTAVAKDPEGRDFVTIKAQDGSVHFSIGTGETDASGVSLASVDWSETMGKSTAIIKKGAETAKLIFSQTEMTAAPPAPGGRGGPRPGLPQGAPPPVTISAAPAAPVVGGGPTPPQPQDGGGRSVPLPRPTGGPSVVPPPPVVSGQQAPSSNGGAPLGDSSRRRIRTIPSPR